MSDKTLLNVLLVVLSLGTILISLKILTTEQACSLDWYVSTAFLVGLILVSIIKNKLS